MNLGTSVSKPCSLRCVIGKIFRFIAMNKFFGAEKMTVNLWPLVHKTKQLSTQSDSQIGTADKRWTRILWSFVYRATLIIVIAYCFDNASCISTKNKKIKCNGNLNCSHIFLREIVAPARHMLSISCPYVMYLRNICHQISSIHSLQLVSFNFFHAF